MRMMQEQSQPKQQAQLGGGNIIINGVLAYFFYVYAFANPDGNEGCWAMAGQTVPKTVEAPHYINVTEQFHVWFLWGFILNVAACVLSVLQFAYACTEADCFKMLSGCVGCPWCCASLGWFIAGMVLRWREVGRVCSGVYTVNDATIYRGAEPYLWKSGSFIHWYSIVTLILIGLLLCCVSCIVCLAAASG